MAEESTAIVMGVIGGSGVYQMEGAEVVREHSLGTPFGRPSDEVVETRISGRQVFFLPRHGRGHRLLPSEVNYRANIHALKQLGVTHVLAVSAAKAKGATVHEGGVYICMEGPQFSTRAESHFYRREVDAAVIGMTALPEAKLAREAELCYAMLAMGTDYDCWHETEEDVSVEAILGILKANAALANATVAEVARLLPATSDCECLSAARYAIITAREAISAPVKERLRVLYGKYF